MSTYDTTNTTPFRHPDGAAFDPLTDLLQLTDFYVTNGGRLLSVSDALARGHLVPSDLTFVACGFEPQVEWGALLFASIPEAPWAGVTGVGQTAATDGVQKRRTKKATKPTHASLCALRHMMGKSSGSPKRWL